MGSIPGSLGGLPHEGRRSDWADDLSRQVDHIIDASAGEARTIAESIRRAFSGERLEQAFSSLRARLRRERPRMGTVEIDPGLELRVRIRNLGHEDTIEEWPRHAVGPPEIRF